jgi:hypothetical protein
MYKHELIEAVRVKLKPTDLNLYHLMSSEDTQHMEWDEAEQFCHPFDDIISEAIHEYFGVNRLIFSESSIKYCVAMLKKSEVTLDKEEV